MQNRRKAGRKWERQALLQKRIREGITITTMILYLCFKIYRSVNWKMQIKINQVKQCFHAEYGTNVDEFLESIYQAGMDINLDMENMKERIEAINQANKYLKLIDEAVALMRKYHPQGRAVLLGTLLHLYVSISC